MIAEWLPCGDLYKFLGENCDEILPLNFVVKAALDVATGMDFLHSTTPPILHRGLFPFFSILQFFFFIFFLNSFRFKKSKHYGAF
jgi:hypothetical protein